MRIEKPEKPEFSGGFIAYLIISALILFCIPFLGPGGAHDEEIKAGFQLFAIIDVVPLVIYYFFVYKKKLNEYNLAEENFDEYERIKTAEYDAVQKAQQEEQDLLHKEYEDAVKSQRETAPWAVRYSTSPCPYCGHYKVRYAKWEDKRASVAFWGAASPKIGTNYKCEHCGRMWE